MTQFKERVPEKLFDEQGHYRGRPADYTDRIISRRLRLVKAIPGFVGDNYRLLDIGCGNGASLFGLAPLMKECTGIEIDARHIEEFKYYQSKHSLTNCDYRVMNIEEQEPPGEFDRIISFEVIEHLIDEDSISFYFKSLKPGGLMAITVPNKWWIFETHGARLPLLPWNRVPFFSWLPRFIHEKFANARIYTKSRITALLRKHGFDILEVKYVTAPMDVLPEGWLKEVAINNLFNTDTTQIPFKAVSIMVVARKP